MEDSSAASDDGHALQRRLTRGIAGFLAVAVILRLVRAIQNYPMWCDETMLAANLLDRNWSELAQPLDYRQVCPLGFLAIEWIAARLVGFSELALRLFPLCSSVASVPFFYWLSRRYLGRGTPGTFLAVAFFAVSEPLIRYAGEAKPYESDLLVSLVLLWLCARWISSPGTRWGLWLIAGVVPLAIGVSLPSLFTIAAIGVVAVWELFKKRSASIGLPLAAFVATTGISVGLMAALGQYRVSPDDRAYFLKFWAGAFPPSILDPGALWRWLLRMATGPLFAFPHGGDLRLAWLTPVIFGCFALGTMILLRSAGGWRLCLLFPFC